MEILGISQIKFNINPNDQIYGTVYQTTVTNSKDDVAKIYYGLCETAFKKRYRNHTICITHEKNRKETELSNDI